MKRLIPLVLFITSIACATVKGETTVLHPSMVGDKESYISVQVKDYKLPYMKFNHIAGMHPVAYSRVAFMVRTFSTTKDQVDPKQNKFYLVNDKGTVFKVSTQRRNNIIERHREVSATHDVAGQMVRIQTDNGVEMYQMHYLEDRDTRIDYYYGYCELEFEADGIITSETKSLTLVAEQYGRTLKFVWHITKDPREASPYVTPEFKTQDNWGNASRFMPENNPGSQRVVKSTSE